MIYTRVLFLRLGIILGIFTICRVLFYIFNNHLFPDITITDLLWILFVGLRFDISAIIYLNLLLILLHIIPLPYRNKSGYQLFVKVLYYVVNGVALLFAVADIGYFQFTLKRTTYDVLGIANEFFDLLPRYLIDFWYLILILGVCFFIIEFFYRRIRIKESIAKGNYFAQTGYFLLFIILFGVMARGGLQYIPISPITSVKYVPVELSPLVTNTPFVFLYSVQHKSLDEINYYNTDVANEIYPIFHHYTKDQLSNKKKSDTESVNVIIIVMESMSKEYCGYYNSYKGYTPFLDSLTKKGLACINGFANGKHSNEGLVAITSAIPSLMNEAFINSVYQDNHILGLAAITKRMGYRTAFFHGGNNGTFGFDYFSKSVGFDSYYGREEYDNDRDYDNYWGIYDEPFFQYFANELDHYKEPFCACFFSLTSHHPYSLPDKYEGVFNKGKIEIHESIGYADHALEQFFKTASKKKWFNNTLFVITADHTGPSEIKKYKSKVGMYQLPIIFYQHQTDLQGIVDFPVQHSDILPSVLDYIGFDGNFTAFGSSIFDTIQPKFVFNYLNGIYQIIDDKHSLLFDGDKPIGLYAYKEDKKLKNNLLKTNPQKAMVLERKLKAVIQQYNYSLINNRMTPE